MPTTHVWREQSPVTSQPIELWEIARGSGMHATSGSDQPREAGSGNNRNGGWGANLRGGKPKLHDNRSSELNRDKGQQYQ